MRVVVVIMIMAVVIILIRQSTITSFVIVALTM